MFYAGVVHSLCRCSTCIMQALYMLYTGIVHSLCRCCTDFIQVHVVHVLSNCCTGVVFCLKYCVSLRQVL